MVAGLEPARGRESIAPGRSIPTALPLSYTMQKCHPGGHSMPKRCLQTTPDKPPGRHQKTDSTLSTTPPSYHFPDPLSRTFFYKKSDPPARIAGGSMSDARCRVWLNHSLPSLASEELRVRHNG